MTSQLSVLARALGQKQAYTTPSVSLSLSLSFFKYLFYLSSPSYADWSEMIPWEIILVCVFKKERHKDSKKERHKDSFRQAISSILSSSKLDRKNIAKLMNLISFYT